MTETPEQRSRTMRAVKSRDTTAELRVRRLIHRMGYRYRLHRHDLPGKPDIVLPRHGKVIFVNGCFWHGHTCVRGDRMPKTNSAYWSKKIARNRDRDQATNAALTADNWEVETVWECETKDEAALRHRISAFLKPGPQ
jgi:DNA mismatch endonuclease (patch repair protein)